MSKKLVYSFKNNRVLDSSAVIYNRRRLKQIIDGLMQELEDATTTGTSITVNDSANAPAKLGIGGNTFQNQYEGYNLINIAESYTWTGDKGISVSLTAGTYRIICETVSGGGESGIKLVARDNNKQKTLTNNTNTTITLDSDETQIRFYSNGWNASASAGISATVNKLMISAEQHDYEPYVGGQPSPSPSYPQTIHNVSGHNEFKISNADDTEYQTAEFTLVEGQKMYESDYPANDGIHHVRTQVILDGTEDCTLRSINDNGTYTYVFTGSAGLLRKIKNNLQNSICSHFLYGGLVSNGDQTKTKGIGYYFYYTYGGLNKTLYINSDISNKQDFKSWLAQQYQNGTPVTIEYEVEGRYTTAYTETQQLQYNALQNVMSYYEQTNVNTITAGDLEAILTLGYKKSSNIRIKTLENQNESILNRLALLEG